MKISHGIKKAFVVFLAVALAAVAFAGVVPVCKGCCCCAKFAGEALSNGIKKCCCSDKADLRGGCAPKAEKPASTEAAYDSSRPIDSRETAAAVSFAEKPAVPPLSVSSGVLSLEGMSPPLPLHARLQRFDC